MSFTSDNDQPGFATRAIHSGYNPFENEGALTPPLHLTSTFLFETAEEGGARFAGEADGHIYSRISNPTLDLLERRVADLEGAEAGLACASGMGAITSSLWALLSPGDELIVDKTLYGCTFSFMRHSLTKFGIELTHVDMRDPQNLADAISSKTRVVFFETPANPNMRLVDIETTAKIAHDAGAIVVVDNTYASPMITRPVSLGADLVVHSATKYLGGHGDLIGGIAVGSAELITEIRMVGMKDMTGAAMAPFNAMLILRGLKTLEIRMTRHTESAMEIAHWLESHASVTRVYYPGLLSFEQHELAAKQMAQFGGMIAFEVVGGIEGGIAFMNELKMIGRAVSLGDAESLIQHPASMTHSTYTPEEREEHGISDGLIRLSVGLENCQDILADLTAALQTCLPRTTQAAAE